jgi:hypothetical protein
MLKLIEQMLSFDGVKLELAKANYDTDGKIYGYTATFLLSILERFEAEIGENPFSRDFEMYARAIGPFILLSETNIENMEENLKKSFEANEVE